MPGPPSIRHARPDDAVHITDLLRATFPTPDEARLVDLFSGRNRGWQLVAEQHGRLVGHIAFTPVTIDGMSEPSPWPVNGLGLAPLAVLPEVQRQGIGSSLVRAGIDECRRLASPFVVVLGDPTYYSRFGFEPASRWKLHCEFGGGDAFQLLPLAAIPRPEGLVRYCAEFHEVFGGEHA